jgi:hypothetical protein
MMNARAEMKKDEKKSRLLATKQVAAVLGIPEWRVKNFSEGGAYGFSPSQVVGQGRGGRKLYSLADTARLAIANELVNYGFTAEVVGRAIREIPESKLIRFWEVLIEPLSRGKSQKQALQQLPFLVLGKTGWRLKKAVEVRRLLKNVLDNVGGLQEQQGLFILDFTDLLATVSLHWSGIDRHERKA